MPLRNNSPVKKCSSGQSYGSLISTLALSKIFDGLKHFENSGSHGDLCTSYDIMLKSKIFLHEKN